MKEIPITCGQCKHEEDYICNLMGYEVGETDSCSSFLPRDDRQQDTEQTDEKR